jgi:hypothetical protein
MRDKKDLLWPYKLNFTFLVVLLIWIMCGLILALTYSYLGWPDRSALPTVLIVVLILGLLPLMLRLLDYLSIRRASVDAKLFKIDFSNAAVSQTSIETVSVQLPANIGIPGTALMESGVQIIDVLDDAPRNEVVVVDLEDGNAWWVTRFLALCGGAVRAGSPRAIVIVGTTHNMSGIFLGWIRPADALKAILNSKSEYRDRHLRAKRISQQLLLFGDDHIKPACVSLQPEVDKYKLHPGLMERGDAAFEQILMDQLRAAVSANTSVPPLEIPPDRLTVSRSYELFRHTLYCDHIDLNQPDEEQINMFLTTEAPYIALVRDKKYVSMLERTAGERLILRRLYEAMTKTETL